MTIPLNVLVAHTYQLHTEPPKAKRDVIKFDGETTLPISSYLRTQPSLVVPLFTI